MSETKWKQLMQKEREKAAGVPPPRQLLKNRPELKTVQQRNFEEVRVKAARNAVSKIGWRITRGTR